MSGSGKPTQPLNVSAGNPQGVQYGRASGALPNAGGIPSFSQLSAFAVNAAGWEAIRQSLYDSIAYPAAGLNTAAFFQLPVGQGVGFGGGPKSLSDTNMQLAGQLPAMQAFLVQSVELRFNVTTPTVTAQMPAVFGAQAVAALVNDAYIFWRSGNLTFFVGSKSYLQEAPLFKFPPKAGFALDAALCDTTSAAASSQSRIAYAGATGRPYILTPGDIQLTSNQNFGVSLNWPEGLQAVTNPARIFVTLDGVLYRRSQ
jgi:hypothetical protein